jgi:hypothetical protein
MKQTHKEDSQIASIPELEEAETLANDLKQILIRFEQELVNGDAREDVEKLELWVESYLKGLRAAQMISTDGAEMMHKIRDQLKLALEERQRLEDDGGNPPPNTEQEAQLEEFTRAIKRIERLTPTVEQSFQYPLREEEKN